MNAKALEKIKLSIEEWNNRKYYKYQNKKFVPSKNPINPEEYTLQFKTSLHSIFCNGELIKIDLASKLFYTTTLETNPISENENSDKIRLDKFLMDFDDQFNELVEEKLSECSETLFTSNPNLF